jgi:hypothetical protein
MNRFRALFTITLSLALVQSVFAQTPTNTAAENQSAPPPGTVTGSGTTDYIPIWTSSTALGDSVIYQRATDVGIGTITPKAPLDVVGNINTSKAYGIGGSDALAEPGGGIGGNTAVGYQSLSNVTSSGFGNTAIGQGTQYYNTTGQNNTAAGAGALEFNTSGSQNTAYGAGALDITSGSNNTAVGFSAAADLETGSYNIAIGYDAMLNLTTGSSNIAIGNFASNGVLGGDSNNIQIGNAGSANDNGTIRIGTAGTQTTFFGAGIYGVSAGNNDAIPVLVDSGGQLVTVSSSRRYKEDIQDMGEASRGLMQLRPVTFRYKKPLVDGSQPLQYGLIAEEVAEVYPDLVAYSADGQIETVKYQLLDPMLLNEVQRQQAEIHALQDRLDRMDAALAEMSRTSAAAR